MQIHELTKKKNTQLDEGVGDAIGGAAGSAVSGVKRVGSAIASPFKDVAMGYQTGRADQRTAALADKFQRAWQQYAQQWAKSMGGQYTAPGRGAAPVAQTTAAQTPAGQTAAAPRAKGASTAAANQQALYSTIQSLDNKALNGVIKILSQRVGPTATMNALKTPEPTNESQLDEISWQGIKQGAGQVGQAISRGASRVGQAYRDVNRDITRGAAQLGQTAKSVYKTAAPMVKQAAKAGVGAIKAAPGAVATAAGGTAGAIAGMPARASTAYRASKATTSGPKLTMQELQTALFKLTPAQAQKLYAFAQQVQAARKAGIKEGITPDTLVPDFENALKAFVQKNMLSGMQYTRLQNAAQIDDLIKKMVDPANDSAAAQTDLWNKLTLAASVAQHTPAGGGNKTAPAAGGQQTTQTAGGQQSAASGESAQELQGTIAQALSGLGQDKNAKTVGQLIRKNFTDNAVDIGSTGVPAVDAMLINMGFRPA